MQYLLLDKPTRLYIKICPHCGLKYFGKTTLTDIEKYQGSGIIWTKHLIENKVKAIHVWNSEWYNDNSITKFALKFSKLNNIVKSEKWANLIEENGIDGGFTGETEEQRILRLQKSLITRNSTEWKETRGKEIYQKLSKKTKGIPRPWVKNSMKERHNKIKNGELINQHTKIWSITDPNGKNFIVDNLPLFCKENNLSQGNLSKYGKSKGYIIECLGFAKDLKVSNICDKVL